MQVSGPRRHSQDLHLEPVAQERVSHDLVSLQASLAMLEDALILSRQEACGSKLLLQGACHDVSSEMTHHYK